MFFKIFQSLLKNSGKICNVPTVVKLKGYPITSHRLCLICYLEESEQPQLLRYCKKRFLANNTICYFSSTIKGLYFSTSKNSNSLTEVAKVIGWTPLSYWRLMNPPNIFSKTFLLEYIHHLGILY